MLLIKRYSENTVNTYVSLLQNFQKHIGFENTVESLSDREIYNEIVKLIEKTAYSYSSQKQLLSTIKLYLSEIHNRDIDLKPVYPVRKPQKLPIILSTLEVKKILLAVTNIKHKAMLATVYALGLRSGELINLRINDIHKDQQLIHIKASKGNKDRVLPLPEKLRIIWTCYYKKYQPKEFLFEGQKGGKYTSTSLLLVFKNTCKKANISNDHTIHSLRHAYATHLFDRGTDIRMIQKLLGHDNIKTTLIYTQVSKRSMLDVKSPLEDIL
ncbi:integrase [Dokdonia pacifica]|uniref:Site-specific recombinase XerD n=1 Tax=Dokdonia pacifica TaxID=1627892 RepID=A0A239DZB4_9FLAO|nr:tyrosine-type recombinase/integrase [Dokdonia pacifica]GGG41502.1 integrase [Dokdonia pacifica]SNS37063.1 Site-specific recombinase XerD [Dokdonia pacifica]